MSDETPDENVLPDVKLNITKELITPGPIYVGDNITYTITITNNGESVAHNVVVNDTVKGSGVVVSCKDNNGKSYQGSVWTIDSVGNHSDIVLTVVVRVTGAGTIVNNVTAKSDENDTNVSDETPDEDVLPDVKLNITKELDEDVLPDVKLNITKELITPGPIYVGDNITYTITITNNGNSDATNVKVTDIIKGSGVIVSCKDNDGKSYQGSVWTIDSVAAHDNVILTVVVRVTDVGTIANNVTAKSDENDTNVTDETPEEDVNPDVKLDIVKVLETTDPIYVGDNITYTITITNNGNSDATNVKVIDVIKGSGVIVSCKDDNGKSYQGSVWTIDSVAAHDNVVLTVVVRVTDVGTIVNNVTAKSDENDTNVYDETPEEDVNPDVRLNITKSVVGEITEVYVGDEITYNIIVTNNGLSTATNVNVKEQLSEHVVVLYGGEFWNNDTNEWVIPSLANGSSTQLYLVVRVISNGTVANAIVAKADENDTEVTANSTNVTAKPDVKLNITKSVVGGITEVYVGDEIVYSIIVTNNGLSTATNVNVKEQLSEHVVVIYGGEYWNNDTKEWVIPSVAIGTSAQVYLVVKVISNGTVANAVIAKAKENDTEVTANSTNVTAKPDVKLNITKSVVGEIAEVYVGDEIVYNIIVTNNGLSTATNVNIKEELSEHVVVLYGGEYWNMLGL